MKKAVSMFLVLMMTAGLFTGCGSSGEDKESAKDEGGSKTESDAGGGEEAKGFPTEIDMDEEPYTVAIQVVTLPGTKFEGEAEREEAINAITVPAINCKVDIQEVWISEIANTTSMAVAGDEKIDLVHAATVNPLSSLVGSEILLDMNEDNLLQNRGKDLVELFGQLMKAGEVNGQQLAVPAQTFNASGKGFFYNKTVADELGITIPEKGTMDDLEAALKQIKEKKPDMTPFFVGTGDNNYLYWLQGYEGFGNNCGYGAVLDSSKELKVVNLYETDIFKNFCLRMFNWKQQGLQPGDPTDTNTAQTYANAGQLFAVVSDINEKLKAEYGAQAEFEYGWCTIVEPKITNSSVTEYMWGITSNSERPDKAMDFLNFIYKNADVANILKNGMAGTNYNLTEGSSKVIIPNGTYLPLFYNAGNEREMLVQAPAGEDYIEKREEMEKAATVSPIVDYMFNDADFQTESSVLNSTILEYLPGLQNGVYDSEEATLAAIEEFNQKLKASGIEDVIAANQEQLDSWLAEQEK